MASLGNLRVGIVYYYWCRHHSYGKFLIPFFFIKLSSVNLCGVIRVTKAFLPLICRSRGRIVNVSSILGRVADPFSGAYCISKFAMKAFSDILRLEVNPLKVKVSLIEPGNFMSAVNIVAGKDASNARTRQMWDQLPDSVKQDYGEESLLRQTRLWEAFLNLAVCLFYLFTCSQFSKTNVV